MAMLRRMFTIGISLYRLPLFFAFYKYSILIVCLVTAGLFFTSIPIMFYSIKENCITDRCVEVGAVPPGLDALNAIGWNEAGYALFYTSLYVIFGIAFLSAAILIWMKKRNDRMSLFSILTLTTFGVTFTEITTVLNDYFLLVDFLNGCIEFIGMICITLFFYLFPNGKFVPKWTGWLAVVLIAPRGLEVLLASKGWSLNDSPWMIGSWLLIWLISQLVSQIYRYRFVSTEVEQQQTKWVLFGFLIVVVGFLSVGVIPVLFNEQYITEGGPIKFAIMNACIYLVFLALPITITYSIFRRRLWDIDIIVNRTFVYGILSLFIVGVYILVVWYLSYLFQQQGNLVFSLIATTIVALSFAPIKEKIQRIANSLMFGERDNPYIALEKLSNQLERVVDPEKTLEIIVKAFKDSMRIPFVSITVFQKTERNYYAAGTETKDLYGYVLKQNGEELGLLQLSPRFEGEIFSHSDQRLLEILIKQATMVIHNLKSDLEVRVLNNRLKQSRERLVVAREEERRRLRRNLHDDLAPRLAALALNAGTVEDIIETNPKTAVVLLKDVREVIRKTVSDIRRLVHDLRPPSLDELGLINAIQERIKDIQPMYTDRDSIDFNFESPPSLPALPAATEVALFRIITEALVNVVKHSNATKCTIHLNVKENVIELSVTDDGVGIPIAPSFLNKGIGLDSMRERAQEVGGEWGMERLEAGTKIWAILPMDLLGREGEKDGEVTDFNRG